MTALSGKNNDVPSTVITLERNKQLAGVYDITLQPHAFGSDVSSFEVHAVLYPYGRTVNARHILFLPFEEYVEDIKNGQRSAYEPVPQTLHKAFGLILGLIITLVFVIFYPEGLFSVDSVVSVIGAYFIGKELWDEIEASFISSTRKRKLRFMEQYYHFQREPNSTLSQYSYFAKKQRYGKTPLMPDLMDFSRQSNSQTLRLFFTKSAYCADTGGHIFSIHIEKEALKDFEKAGFLFGVKVCSTKRRMGLHFGNERFQSLHKGKCGCLNGDQWIDGAVFERRVVSAGRFKLFVEEHIVRDTVIVGMQ